MLQGKRPNRSRALVNTAVDIIIDRALKANVIRVTLRDYQLNFLFVPTSKSVLRKVINRLKQYNYEVIPLKDNNGFSVRNPLAR